MWHNRRDRMHLVMSYEARCEHVPNPSHHHHHSSAWKPTKRVELLESPRRARCGGEWSAACRASAVVHRGAKERPKAHLWVQTGEH